VPFRLPAPAARGAADPRDDAGFTVVEAIVAFSLFAMVAGSSITALVSTTSAANGTRDRVTAANIAQQDIQQARSLRYPNYPAAIAAHSVAVGNKTFTVSRAISNTCPNLWTPGKPTSMQVTTTVTWRGAKLPVKIGTLIAC
jgi:type II secretory pathway pseudopilin PulG